MNILHGGIARLSQKNGAEKFCETGDRQPAGKGNTDHSRHTEKKGEMRQNQTPLEKANINEPLAHKPVQRRQSANRGRSHQKKRAGPRHFLEQSPHPVDGACMNRVDDTAGPQKEKSLEQGMVDDMKKSPRKTQNFQNRLMERLSQ